MKLREPQPAQVEAMRYAFKRARIALFLQMRLGKNLVTIRWAKQHRLDRILVVAPNDVLDDWRDELIREGVGSHDITILDGSRLQKLAVAEEIDTGWAIINYEALRDIRRQRGKDHIGREILQLPWSGIVLDESTAIRNPASQTAKTLMGNTGHITHRAILSGLPNPKSEMDFFAQMVFLNGEFMNYYNYWAWRKRYYFEPSGTYGDYDWIAKPGIKDKIQAAVHKVALFMTRKEWGVGERRVVEKRYIRMGVRQAMSYRKVEKEFAFDTIETQWATTKTIWLARIAGGFSPDRDNPKCLNPGKVQSVVNLLKGELRQESVVIWFRFNEELFAVRAALKKAKISHTFIIGGQKRTVNHRRKQKFQDGRVQAILMQLKMGKFGWDLSRADTEIRYSEDYDYEVFAQSRDRIVNVRKQTTLLSISLICRDTVDEDIVETLNDRSVTAKTFNLQLAQRLRKSWDLRFVGSGQPRNRGWSSRGELGVRRLMPGDVTG